MDIDSNISPKEVMGRKRPSSAVEYPPAKRLKCSCRDDSIEEWRSAIQPLSHEGEVTDARRKHSRASLTEKNLHTVPSTNLYHTKDSAMSQAFSESQGDEASSLGPTNPEYEARLKDRQIYCMRKTAKPSNLDEVRAALEARRNSPEPDDQTAENFSGRVKKSGNEGGAMQGLLPKILPIIDRFWDSEFDAHPVDQQWDRRMLLDPDCRPAIKPPKPDQAFGFTLEMFPFPQANLFIKPFMCPARNLAWPYFTVEAKGRQGHLDVARLQNSLNGAIMMNNMLRLKQALNKEDEFLGRIVIMTMELTTESISLSGHFMLRNNAGDIERHSICLHVASAVDPTGIAFKNSYKQAMNGVELFRERTIKWILEDMAALEEKLVKGMQRGLNQITPPSSQPGRSQSRNRSSSSRASSRATSRSNLSKSNLCRQLDDDLSASVKDP